MTTLWLTVRWTLARTLSRPLTWILCATLCGLWIGLAVATPLGISTRDRAQGHAENDIAFIGLLIGSLVALPTLAMVEPLLGRATFIRREGTILIVTATTLALFLLAATLPPLLDPNALPTNPARLTLALLHFTVLTCTAFRLPTSTAWRSLALVFLAWALPAVLHSPSLPSRLLRHLLDPAQHLAVAGSEGGTVLPTLAAPILGLWALSALAAPHTRRPITS